MQRVFMVTDIEGVAGVVSFADQSYSDGKYFEQAKRLATAEINAAVDGMCEAGVEDILVWDGHGPGGVNFEELHAAAKLLHGRPLVPFAQLAPVIRRYEALVIIGQHAMAGVRAGNLAHTQDSRAIDYYRLNGRPIGEIAQMALYCGALGLPLIFLSGDEEACAEARALVPGIHTAAVKEGLGRNSAISVSTTEARRRIRTAIRAAVEAQAGDPISPLVWPGPYVLEKRFFHTDRADVAAAQPGVERIDDQTVRLRGDNIADIIYR